MRQRAKDTSSKTLHCRVHLHHPFLLVCWRDIGAGLHKECSKAIFVIMMTPSTALSVQQCDIDCLRKSQTWSACSSSLETGLQEWTLCSHAPGDGHGEIQKCWAICRRREATFTDVLRDNNTSSTSGTGHLPELTEDDLPANGDLLSFIRAHSPDGDYDLLPGLCTFTERWLTAVLHPFLSLHGHCCSRTAAFHHGVQLDTWVVADLISILRDGEQ